MPQPTPPPPCNSNPLIKLGNDANNAPTLNYSLEQKNCTNLKSRMPLAIPADWFIAASPPEPNDVINFWQSMVIKPKNEIIQILKMELNNQNSIIFDNYNLLHSVKHAIIFYQHTEPLYAIEDKELRNPLFLTYSKYPLYNSNGKNNVSVIAVFGNKSEMKQVDGVLNMPLSETKIEQPFLSRKLPNNISFSKNYVQEFDIEAIADKFKLGYRGIISMRPDGNLNLSYYKPETIIPVPQLFLEYDLMMCSYLGNYGAGKTVGTFSLLPGEKTTISIRTYKDLSTSRSRAENVLESSSQNSVNSLQNQIQSQTVSNTDTSFSGSYTAESSASISIPIFSSSTAGVGASASGEKHLSTATTIINNAVSQTVEEANSHREININSTVNEQYNIGEETSTIRELENINLSRTLNFVFRQLLQEYITITWLRNIKFGYTTGLPGSTIIVQSQQAKDFLNGIIVPEHIDEAYAMFVDQASFVFNYIEDPKAFFECRTFTTPPTNCCDGTSTQGHTKCLWLRMRNLTDSFENITVPGIILNVDKHVLKTSSVIVDALLGQGEALDCYNTHTQQQSVISQQLNNQKTEQAINIIDGFTTVEDKAKNYKKIFGDCCDVPQSGCNCNQSNTPA